jgi:hypothetical protein
MVATNTIFGGVDLSLAQPKLSHTPKVLAKLVQQNKLEAPLVPSVAP